MFNLKSATALLNFAFKPAKPKYSWQNKLCLPNLDVGDPFKADCLQTKSEAKSESGFQRGLWKVMQTFTAVCVHLAFS